MGLILNAQGHPEVPDAIRRRIAAMDAGLSLVFRGGAWWLMQRWREGDPRWAWVQDGRIPESEALDGLGAFPVDIGFDSMPAFIEKSLREYPVRDLKRIADSFAAGEGIAPEAEAIKDEMFEEVIKQTESEKGVTGRRTKHAPSGKTRVGGRVSKPED